MSRWETFPSLARIGIGVLTAGLVLAPVEGRSSPSSDPVDTAEVVLSADRPGFSDATRSVPFGHVAVEGGVGLIYDDDVSELRLPFALVRVGLPAEGFEARLNLPSLVVWPGSEGTDSLGASSLGIGAKYAAEVGSVSASAVATVMFPTASEGFGDDDVGARLGLNAAVDTDTPVSVILAGNVGFSEGAVQAGGAISGNLAIDAFGFYAQALLLREAAALPPPLEGEAVAVSAGFGAGVTVQPSPRMQLDLFLDLIAPSAADDPWSGILGLGAGYLF